MNVRAAYEMGMIDGIESTLRLVLGLPTAGGQPYPGPVPNELRGWAGAVLRKIEDSRGGDRPGPVDPGDPVVDDPRADEERDRYQARAESWDAT